MPNGVASYLSNGFHLTAGVRVRETAKAHDISANLRIYFSRPTYFDVGEPTSAKFCRNTREGFATLGVMILARVGIYFVYYFIAHKMA